LPANLKNQKKSKKVKKVKLCACHALESSAYCHPCRSHNGADKEGSRMKFIVKETQHACDQRAGVEIEAKDLTAAKRAASRMQQFKGTVLRVADAKGFELAFKEGGKWQAA
jgi:hypothetical protein